MEEPESGIPLSPELRGDDATQGDPRQPKKAPSLPLGRKVCYALGGAPYQLTGNAIGFFLQIFLLDVIQLAPFHASMILFLGRAWDAISDPAIGFLVSRSPQRKCGKLMPWIVVSTPFAVLCYFFLWFSPSNSASVTLKFLWFLAMYCFFQTCMSCYHVPYTSLTMFLGGSQQDRDSATAYSSLSPLLKSQVPFIRSLRVILGHTPYKRLVMGFLSASLAFQLAQGIFAFFCTHAAGLAGSFQHLVLIMLVSASLSLPFWQWFLVKFGKKPAVIVGLSFFIPPLIVLTQVNNNFLVFAFMMVIAGFSVAVLYLLPWSMLPDAVDDFKVKNPDCLNLEAFFYSFYVFFNKFAGGLSLGMSTLALHFAGYKAGDCTPNPNVITVLQVLMAPAPIALVLFSIFIFCSYPINEARRKQIRVELEKARNQ
ncbi:sodium-dependent lysophosphatidylcholine symporter 1-B-like isoform X3 [Lissotriton helveticus]